MQRHHVTQNTKIPTSLKENIWPGCQRNAMVIMNVALLFTNNWDSAFMIFLCFALSVYNIFFFLARMHCTVFTDVDWGWERGDYVCMEVTVNSTPNLYILYLHIQYIFYVFGPNGLLEKKKKNLLLKTNIEHYPTSWSEQSDTICMTFKEKKNMNVFKDISINHLAPIAKKKKRFC